MGWKSTDIAGNGKEVYADPKGAEEYFRKIEKEGKHEDIRPSQLQVSGKTMS